MDRREAIRELTQWRNQMKRHGVPNYGKKLTALDLAIEALREPTEEVDYCNNCPYISWDKDCISRQQAVEAVTNTIREKFSLADWYEQLVETGLEIENLIKELPPVTPTERTGEWIPVSKELPKEDGLYFVQLDFNDESGRKYKFTCRWADGWNCFRRREDGVIVKEHEIENVVAWMELPDDYEGGEEND